MVAPEAGIWWSMPGEIHAKVFFCFETDFWGAALCCDDGDGDGGPPCCYVSWLVLSFEPC